MMKKSILSGVLVALLAACNCPQEKKAEEVTEKVIENVIEKVRLYALGNKLKIISIIDSPILGGDGNKEKLALIKGIF